MNDSEEPDGRPGNSTALAIIEPATGLALPAMIAAAGERARLRFIGLDQLHTEEHQSPCDAQGRRNDPHF